MVVIIYQIDLSTNQQKIDASKPVTTKILHHLLIQNRISVHSLCVTTKRLKTRCLPLNRSESVEVVPCFLNDGTKPKKKKDLDLKILQCFQIVINIDYSNNSNL